MRLFHCGNNRFVAGVADDAGCDRHHPDRACCPRSHGRVSFVWRMYTVLISASSSALTTTENKLTSMTRLSKSPRYFFLCETLKYLRYNYSVGVRYRFSLTRLIVSPHLFTYFYQCCASCYVIVLCKLIVNEKKSMLFTTGMRR